MNSCYTTKITIKGDLYIITIYVHFNYNKPFTSPVSTLNTYEKRIIQTTHTETYQDDYVVPFCRPLTSDGSFDIVEKITRTLT